ncbi:hypothetical protein SDRG_08132 [Saprolegnia diclina VS20]|uniref:Uncharacterized protein n=1 Tax=Saprolegnia diclina (strain VS20) TaxID=1156394 RepID=T0QHY9_SAPDV|nr:hypothetical protein SDRG_08132 [Saprolegnia diclina VS20]EQC34361.1 hypothetical protein SDRG_08132 [Saprolegnia diclina VS20]|eukprot:XP_008612223.1 hypothetical protein SDRG_08132 [Saprolegnia diclina VS20]
MCIRTLVALDRARLPVRIPMGVGKAAVRKMRVYLTVLLAASAVRGNDNVTTTAPPPSTTPPSVITFPPRTTLPPAVVSWPPPSPSAIPFETPLSPTTSPDSVEGMPTIVVVSTERPSKQSRPNSTSSSSLSSGGQSHKTLYVLLGFGLAVFVLGMLFVLICSLYKKKMKILRLRALQHASNSRQEASDATEFARMPSPKAKRVSFEVRSTLSSEPRSSVNPGNRLPPLTAESATHHHL